jgi:hypothetical protein
MQIGHELQPRQFRLSPLRLSRRKVQLRHTSCAFFVESCNSDTRVAPFSEKGATRTHELRLSRRMVQTWTHELHLSRRKVQLAHTSCAFLEEKVDFRHELRLSQRKIQIEHNLRLSQRKMQIFRLSQRKVQLETLVPPFSQKCATRT